MRRVWAASAVGGAMWSSAAALAAGGGPAPVVELPTLDIFSTTPLSGTGIDVTKVPAAVTSVDAQQIVRQRSSNVVGSLSQATPSVNVQSVSGNDFQPDVFFRGFDASPVNGTPQGLAVYQNGVRINEAFGDTVNWDVIPTAAVRGIEVISNNPAFGLNALGGAISMQMKDGFNFSGLTLDVMGGAFGRVQGSLQYGKQVGNWATYIAIEGAHDGGYRKSSPSQLRRVYGDIGYKNENGEFHLSVGGADNRFGASASAPFELLQQSWSNVYTTPQTSRDQVAYVNATGAVTLSPTWSLQANAHLRTFHQSTVDGNATNTQPCDPSQGGAAGLLCFNDAFTPANGLGGAQLANAFPPGATLGEIDRTHTQSTTTGATLQATDTNPLFGHANHFVIGASFDYGVTHYGASAELATINPDFSLTGAGVFLGPSGNPVSAGPVSLRTTNAYTGVYVLDAFDVTDKLTVSAGGRFNYASIRLQDQLGGALNGGGDFQRFNPMIGATYKITSDITAYAGYSEANRAPTPLELGCADPVHPCILASFLVSDPALQQVVARTAEAGLRGSHALGEDARLNWRLGVYRTNLSNDILNVADPVQQGFGYFQNVGGTRRQGFEAHVDYKTDRLTLAANYAYIDATFLNAVTLGSHSPFADASGNIHVSPGNQLPAIPHHRVKLSADYDLTPQLKIGADINIVGSQYFVGDESNQFAKLPAYWFASLDASYQVTKNIQIYAKAENIFNNSYYTYGTFFDTGGIPNFANGGAPFADPRSLSPARPRAIYAGLRATF